ncbi:MAG: (d)CMP kinase [Candidatus Omnitrophota bacterium]|nr:(d)CMP kinase [Candidatus Omnitrophota bacterium]
MKDKLIIAIDGPAGSGKSTVAKEVARRMGFLYVDTGAMYRALTLKAVRKKIGLNDANALIELAKNTDIRLKMSGDFILSVLLDGEDVSGAIRMLPVTNNVKYIARVPGVRKHMAALQRKTAFCDKGAVLEGRDIGTVVFPGADKKIYLDAAIEERAKRRHKELIEKGQDVEFDKVREDVKIRDHSDETRKTAPLKKADDALIIDTTNLTAAEAADRIIKDVTAVKK